MIADMIPLLRPRRRSFSSEISCLDIFQYSCATGAIFEFCAVGLWTHGVIQLIRAETLDTVANLEIEGEKSILIFFISEFVFLTFFPQ